MNKLLKILLVLCVMVSQFTFVEKIQAKEETSIQSIEMFEEVFEKRSESSKTFQTGINSYQTFQFASRVHYIDSNGNYQNIDNTLQAYTDRTSDDVNGYENKANDIYFEDIQLLKKKVAVYDYDDNGDLKSDTKTNYVYENGDLKSFTNAIGETTTYGYDANHNLISSQTSDGIKSEYTYDSAGNVIITSINSKENDTKIVTSNTYDDTKSFLMYDFDEDGYTTTYDYTKSKNQLKSISKKMNEDVTQITTYTYNNSDQLASQSSKGISVNYTYNAKQLLYSITRNTQVIILVTITSIK